MFEEYKHVTMPDEKTVNQILEGGEEEKKALKEIYATNFNAVHAMVTQNHGSSEDAQDIFQEGIIELYKNIHSGKFKGKSLLSTYLYSICKFIWLKRLRRKKKDIELINAAPAYHYEDERHLLVDKTKAEIISELFDQIGEPCKSILTLFYYERRKMSLIAELTGFKNEQTARNKKVKCLKALKNILDMHPKLRDELKFHA